MQWENLVCHLLFLIRIPIQNTDPTFNEFFLWQNSYTIKGKKVFKNEFRANEYFLNKVFEIVYS